jgi:2-polyprenyl-3-methyl-5-hydroxy-6-metoxy-1,4-benzoquinol methylase
MKISQNKSNEEDIFKHLERCSNQFIPSLDTYVNIKLYSKKIYEQANRFEIFNNNHLKGLIAVYINNSKGFITNVSIEEEYQGKNLAKILLDKCFEFLILNNCNIITLNVNIDNLKAINFYLKNGFKKIKQENNILIMEKNLRDYNKEFLDTKDHKYAYNFDFDIMHHYMIESFKNHFVKGNCLELGSFKGDFTKRLIPYFEDITCVEASDEAIEIAKEKLNNKNIVYTNSMFEDAVLPKKYDNIILTHVLEHIDNPVGLLKRIKEEWLSEDGKLFLVCPNANAPSRQIAVKIGLITHNSAITPAEVEHGHRITYTLDTLERDAKEGGLNVIYRSGIFFKALANFQWDKLLNTDIISKEYLDGCYQLGQQYPDLCSSIMLICKK